MLNHLTSLIRANQNLSAEQAQQAFASIMAGTAEHKDIAGFLLALKAKGETATEIAAAAGAMRQVMKRFDAPADAMDVCGTGGDGSHSLNISTAVAIVVAACGVPVVKHGNRAVSSQSGSSDVLQALGVNIDASEAQLAECLAQANICFLMAPHFHPAMRHVAPVRQQLKTRTIFNLLGPLCNPAGVTRQLLGVYAPDRLQMMAEALKQLGSQRAWVVHGDGLDELSISAESQIVILRDGDLTAQRIAPEAAGLTRSPISALNGGDAAYNAAALKTLLHGAQSAYRDAVLLNAAAALIIAEKAHELKDGAAIAAEAIDSGQAIYTLERWVEISCSI
jgi:anthranilate phosphoribosyltransferase